MASMEPTNQSGKPKIIIDGVIFQLQASGHGGISRVWRNLIPELMRLMPEGEFLFLRRQGSNPRVSGILEREIPSYAYASPEAMDADDALLERICREEQASIFISTYYTRAPGVPNVILVHDMIPEVLGFDLDEPSWISKRRAFSSASSFVSVSVSTRNDLCRLYDIDPNSVSVAYPGLNDFFQPASQEEVRAFRERWDLHDPFYLLVGHRGLYKNGVAALRGFAASSLLGKARIVAAGGEYPYQPSERQYADILTLLPALSDEDLRCAYSAANALIYPSQYEGFGLPVVEAMASGCPVITCRTSSLPEVGGDACLYVDPFDPQAMAEAIEAVCDADRRHALQAAGKRQASRFSWENMALSFSRHLRDFLRSETVQSCAQLIENRGELRYAERDLPGAIAAFQMAVKLDPDRVSALNNLGVAYWERGDFVKALSVLESALQLAPDDRDVEMNYEEVKSHLRHQEGGRLPEVPMLAETILSVPQGGDASQAESPYLISAIVSTYNSERFMRGCLEDLVAQTLIDRMEIIVVDSASPQNERVIVEEFQARYPQIVYIRTDERESLYAAWNRGIKASRGKYLTNANTDDRHRRDALERMVEVLERHPEYGLVYADSLITEVENETFDQNTATSRFDWPDFIPGIMLSTCPFSPHPVWRRSVHDAIGYFNPEYRIAGDYDFFSRLARRFQAVHLREPMGLFLQRPDSLSGRDAQIAAIREISEITRAHRSQITLPEVYPSLSPESEPEAWAAALWDFGNLCALSPYSDYQEAIRYYQEAMRVADLPPRVLTHLERMFANNAGVLMYCAGDSDQAQAMLASSGTIEARANLGRIQAGAPAHPIGFQMLEVEHPIVRSARRTSAFRLDSAGRLVRTAQHELPFWEVYVGPNGVPLWDEDMRRALRLANLPSGLSELKATASNYPPQSPIHILMTMYGWAEEGGGTMLPRQIAKALVRRGHKVSVIYMAAAQMPGKPPYHVEIGEDEGVRLYGVYNCSTIFSDLQNPERESDDPGVRGIVADLIDTLKPDLVHYHNLLGFSLRLPELINHLGLPSLYTSHNYWVLCPRLYLMHGDLRGCSGPSSDGVKCGVCVGRLDLRNEYAQRLQSGRAVLSESIDRHLAISERNREWFVKHGYSAQHVVVHHQVPETIDWIWESTGRHRQPKDLLHRPLRVGFIGSLWHLKGVHVLIEALQAFEPGKIEGHIHGGGAEPYVEQLMRLDAKCQAIFHGRYEPEDLPRILEGLDLVVVPSVLEEGAGLVIKEALAARCPVIGSRIGGIPDFIEEGVSGFLFDPGSAVDLASVLYRFLHDPSLLGRLQRNLEEPKGFGVYLDELIQYYYEVLLARRQTSPQPRLGPKNLFHANLTPLPVEGRRELCFFHHPNWRSSTWKDVLVAYVRAFSPHEEVSLVLWLDPEQGVTEEEAGELLAEALVSVGIDPDSCPDILLVPNRLEPENFARLLLAMDWVVPLGDERLRERAARVDVRNLESLEPEAWRAAANEGRERKLAILRLGK